MSQQPSKKPKGTTRADASVTRQKILELLLQGRKVKDIANELGLNLQTVYKYTSDEKFKEELKQHHRETLKALSRKSANLLEQALDVFETLLGDGEAPFQARVNAVRLALDVAVKLDENTHLSEELESLKATIDYRKDILDGIS